MKPHDRRRARILDLFCGAGGAAVGYYRAGFDVVGVDIRLFGGRRMTAHLRKDAPMETICPNCGNHDTIYLRSGGALVCRECAEKKR